jgi:glutaredoxin
MKHHIAAFLAITLVGCAALPACSAEKKLDAFAKCLTEKKATMYGVSWCPHCADQKELFGTSFQYVSYVDCAVPGTHTETEQCKALGIKHTPTWIFSDGSRLEGTIPLDKLSQQTGCKLP